MKEHIQNFRKHPLVSGSSIVFLGSFFINGFNYVFNLIMGRLLTVSEYGLLVALIALITIITIFQSALANLFARFSARYVAQGREDLRVALFKNGLKITGILSVALFFILLVGYVPISYFLHINNPYLLLIVSLCVIISVLSSLPMGILQGELKFTQITILNTLGMASKIGIGILLVLMGYGIAGALSGVFLAYFIPYVFSLFLNRNKRGEVAAKSHVDFYKEFKKVSAPFLLSSVGIIIFQSTDVIFARHFLSPDASGQYAALSLMGKAIFYVTAPIYFVFFPVIMHKREKKQSTFSTLMLALGIVLFCNLFFSMIYIVFPGVILSVFFPQPAYAALSSLLGLYSIYVLIFSLAFLLHTYLLSISKTGIYKPSLLAAVTYIVLLLFFHETIGQLIYVLIFSAFLLLVLLLVYYKRYEHS